MIKDINVGTNGAFIKVVTKIIKDTMGIALIIDNMGLKNKFIISTFTVITAKTVPNVSASKKPENILIIDKVIVYQKLELKINFKKHINTLYGETTNKLLLTKIYINCQINSQKKVTIVYFKNLCLKIK